MANSKKPSGLRPKGFAGLDEMTAAKLAELIAEKQSYIPTEPPENLRSYGYTKFMADREREIQHRALAIALFGIDRCAGCRFFVPDDTHARGTCVRTKPKRNRWPDTNATDWCGRHEPVLAGGA